MAAIMLGTAGAQSTPSFETADVRVSPANGTAHTQGGSFHEGKFDMRTATMADLIGIAYGVHADSLVGAPGWFERDRFDVMATAPAATPPETVRLMLRTLLANRFRLVLHSDEKPMSVFVLEMGKGAPKMKAGDNSGSAGCHSTLPPTPTPGLVTDNMYSCHNMTMEALASSIRGMAGSYLTSPVVDFTGLKGTWNFDMAWTSKGSLQIVGAAGITVFDAVDRQLGLKLEPQKRPLPVLAIDHVEEKPSAN
jgi:uncharacterized protein (TIGR03435 family)